MKFTQYINSMGGAFVAALVATSLVAISYFALEPTISHSAVENFTVSQTVSGAIAFAASTTDVTMVGTLNGLTGGTSYGTTTARVTTNNASGYNMTIKFSSTTAMIRGGDGGAREIYNYAYSTGTANYPAGYDTTLANAQFGFTVNASSTANETVQQIVSDVFNHTGSVCGTDNSGSFTPNNCWRGASSTDETAGTQLVNSGFPTPSSGSTSTVQFRVTIPNNPNPSVPDGTYVATATLTALDN